MGDDFVQMDPACVSAKSFFCMVGYPDMYRPFHHLFKLSLKWIFGLSPMPHFLVVLFLHVGACAGAGYVLYKIVEDWFVVILSSVLYCTFFMHYQSMFHSSLLDQLCVFLFMLSVVFFLEYLETGLTSYYVLCLVAFILSLMTKEYALILPLFVGVMTLVLPHKDIERPLARDYYKPYLRLLKPVLPLLVLSPLWVYIEYRMVHHFFPFAGMAFDSKLDLKAIWRPTVGSFIYCSKVAFYLHWWAPLSFLGGTWRQLVTIGLWTVFVWKYVAPPARRAVIIFFSLFVIGFLVTVPGIAPRFFYLPTIASSAIIAITIKEFSDRVIGLVFGFLRGRFSLVVSGANLYVNVVEGVAYRIVPVILIVPLLLFNYSEIKLYAQDYTRAHQISKSFFEGIRDTYLRTHANSFVYANVPIVYPGRSFPFWLIGGAPQLIATTRVAIEPEDRQVVWLSEGVPQTFYSDKVVVDPKDGPIQYAVYALNLDESAPVVQNVAGEWTHLRVPHYRENIWPTKELNFEDFMRLCGNQSHQVFLYLPSGKLINVSGMRPEGVRAAFSRDVQDFEKRQ